MSVARSRRRRRLRAVPPFRGNVARIQGPRPRAPTETPLVTTGSEPPEQREYTRNVEETNLSLMLHSPRLYSELSHYFKPELFAEKPTAQLWKLMSRGKVTARLEAVENRLALLESQADVTPVHTSKARLIQELLAANPALTVPEIQGRTGIKADTIRKIMLQQKRSEGKEG